MCNTEELKIFMRGFGGMAGRLRAWKAQCKGQLLFT